MKFKTLFLFVSVFGITLGMASAQDLPQSSISLVVSAYRFYKDIGSISINAPTVVEVPFPADFIERFDFAVLDKTANSFEPYFFKQETLINEIPVSIGSNPITNSVNRMNDGDTRTYADFLLPGNAEEGNVQITLSSQNPITSSILTTLLDNNVALPNSVEIRAIVEGQDRIVVANRRMSEQTIRFPQTTSNRWTIKFTYGQPLRISELKLSQSNATKTSARTVRFLAQPAHAYRIYFDPDRSTNALVGEAGNLASAKAKEVRVIASVLSQNNPNYIIADTDNDGVPDISDNCVSLPNSDQLDVNNNLRGDSCDDFDQDGLINAKDNCPNNPNRDQKDTDSDGGGDVCDKEESRITEQHAWIPWVGMGFAALVLITLLALTARSTRVSEKENNK
ncbi:MAG: hypothetical protein HW401_532 [Parcubacteria group bacterium]|nr:hypothetical protein [Parcubacteria group bacterium]